MLSVAGFGRVGLDRRYARIPIANTTRLMHTFRCSPSSRLSYNVLLKEVVHPPAHTRLLVWPSTRSISSTKTRFFVDDVSNDSSLTEESKPKRRRRASKKDVKTEKKTGSREATGRKKSLGGRTKSKKAAKPKRMKLHAYLS